MSKLANDQLSCSAQRRLEQPKWRELARRYNRGENLKKLAIEYGLDIGYVRQTLLYARRAPGLYTAKAREAFRLHEGGCMYAQIARLFGCSKQYVGSLLDGIPNENGHRHGGSSSYRPQGWPDMIARGEW